MKHSIRAVLATSAAVALTGLGVAPAAAGGDDPKPQDPAPAWEHIDDRYYFPAWSACKDKIKVHEKYKYRFTILKENDQHAKIREDIHGWVKLYNPKTHKKVEVPFHVESYIHENRKNATAKITDRGVGFWQGPGIKGIVFFKGKVVVKASNVDNLDKLNLDIKKIHGHSKQLCYKLGSKPVNGKLVLPPSAE